MSFRFTIDGIDDFRDLPSNIAAQAGPLTKAAAERAKAAVVAAYPRVTGRLQDGVIIVPAASFTEAVQGYYVITTAHHATPYEFGSTKHNIRPRPTFLPIMKRERQAHVNGLVEIVKGAGFIVTGDDT
jgi:hypothetical protein